jgi:hypothetical protein
VASEDLDAGKKTAKSVHLFTSEVDVKTRVAQDTGPPGGNLSKGETF